MHQDEQKLMTEQIAASKTIIEEFKTIVKLPHPKTKAENDDRFRRIGRAVRAFAEWYKKMPPDQENREMGELSRQFVTMLDSLNKALNFA